MLRDKFVQDFGEDQAQAIEDAAESHKNGIHDRAGSDPFRWAITIVIGYQCVELYKEDHDITVDWQVFKQWVKDNAHLEDHDGDVDFVSLFAGIYNEFMPVKMDA